MVPLEDNGMHRVQSAEATVVKSGRSQGDRTRTHSAKSIHLAFEAQRGFGKADALRLFRKVASVTKEPAGRIRAELIPDSSWKRAGKTLGPQASQAAARLSHVLSLSMRVWGNESDAIEWLNGPHPELRGATPLSFLKTEAGGRAIEALLAALEFGFPV
jgi:putative toxin-antitoxin system antitoxin component (TIGR02293 family)